MNNLHGGGWAAGSFADLWTYSDPEPTQKLRGRDYRPWVVVQHSCPTCGAARGVSCHRVMANGERVIRRLPHFGRAKSGRHVLYGNDYGKGE